MGAFEYRQAEVIRDAFGRHGVRYLFLGKSGAILLGFPDTTQDADIFVEKSEVNRRAIVAALNDLGFVLSDSHAAEAKISFKFEAGHSISTSCSHRMASNDLKTPGNVAKWSRAFPFADSTTSSPARRRRDALKISNRFRDYERFANIAVERAEDCHVHCVSSRQEISATHHPAPPRTCSAPSSSSRAPGSSCASHSNSQTAWQAAPRHAARSHCRALPCFE